jgi:hypothetical protein
MVCHLDITNMFRAYLRPSSGAYKLQQQPLVYRRNVVLARPTAMLPPGSYGKPEVAAAVDTLLMMGIKMPKTC